VDARNKCGHDGEGCDAIRSKHAVMPYITRDFSVPGRSTVHALNGMAATSNPLASLAAIDTLRAGGTAADAAVAAAALLGVIEPQSTGIGGDAFALYAPAGSGRVIAYNGSGAAPAAASADRYLSGGMTAIPLTGPHAVTVPGAVDLWACLLEAHGRKGFDAVLQPAIRAAEQGFSVAPRTTWDWGRNVGKLQAGVNSARYFLPNGAAPNVGDVIRQPERARDPATYRARRPRRLLSRPGGGGHHHDAHQGRRPAHAG
jgi:gamma-glutamyltranspeptidase/glutathione hydrolase